MAPKYPTAPEIHTLFTYLSTGQGDKFWSRVSPNVDWLVPGSNAASGHYHTLADWMAGAAGALDRAFPEPLKLVVTNVIGGGEQEWAVAELSADSTCKNGLPYHQRYPSIDEIKQLCSHLGTNDASPFFDRVSPNVEWDVLGTHPAAGHFSTLSDWKKGALGVINDVLKEPLKLSVVNVAGGGDQAWAVVELKAASVRAYLDSALVQKAVDQNT
ncbi:hypothetical protein B0A48_02833 [Cryoendolithus antarcticus]|uniref:Uncharacterized protein n=1 Tax=Cryoendolithus antarcticus TaxID=1507870 RepID=A0A1V8TLV2_9PEZI|nr:hypothetical protein B0A48_02833 [Cryoendolithus antarcticus]